MKKISEYLFIWALGGAIYYSFEIIFRGFSHWSMFVLGGICFEFIYIQVNLLHENEPLWKQMLRNIIFITSLEFVTGIIVNKWMHWAVWDYTNQPLQLFGQICVPFMIIFSGLSVCGSIAGGYIGYYLYGANKPHFTVL